MAGEGLAEPYIPALIRFDDPPRLEWVSDDVPTVVRTITSRFDLLLSMETREPVGFRLYLAGLEPISQPASRDVATDPAASSDGEEG